MFNLEEGELIIKAARTAVREFFKNESLEPKKTHNKKLNERHGIFVTIKKFPSWELRGCIGYISPIPLYEGVQQAALSAAFRDPRFHKLTKDELDGVVFEVSVMTEPTLVSGKDSTEWKKEIKIGQDGLIISNGPYSGMLLPQVPVEQKWGVEEFLNHLCYKAGMTPDFLQDENTKLWKFQCQIFAENEPNGKVEEIKLK